MDTPKRVVTISNVDFDTGESGDPLVVAQASPGVVRAVMRLLADALEPAAPPRPHEGDQ
jgi:hypothetical protein